MATPHAKHGQASKEQELVQRTDMLEAARGRRARTRLARRPLSPRLDRGHDHSASLGASSHWEAKPKAEKLVLNTE